MRSKTAVPNTYLQSLVPFRVPARHHPTPVRAPYDHCDCGMPKPLDEIACGRCAFLDVNVGRASLRAVVDALRDERSMTSDEIAGAIGVSWRRTHDALQELMRRGRLTRAWEDGDEFEMATYVKGQRFGESPRGWGVKHNGGRWRYQLVG